MATVDAPDDRFRSLLDKLAVVVMSLTAIMSAWSGFQAAKWGGLMSISFSQAGAARTESTRFDNEANQQLAIDIGLFTSFADATADDNEVLADFYLQRFPPRLGVAVDEWLALDPLENSAAPATPFDLESYVIPAADTADELRAEAEQHAQDALDYNQQSDNYVFSSVLFAMVLFFAAFSTKVDSRIPAGIMMAVACVVFVVEVVIIASYPIEFQGPF